jgi:hypothetical protein
MNCEEINNYRDLVFFVVIVTCFSQYYREFTIFGNIKKRLI